MSIHPLFHYDQKPENLFTTGMDCLTNLEVEVCTFTDLGIHRGVNGGLCCEPRVKLAYIICTPLPGRERETDIQDLHAFGTLKQIIENKRNNKKWWDVPQLSWRVVRLFLLEYCPSWWTGRTDVPGQDKPHGSETGLAGWLLLWVVHRNKVKQRTLMAFESSGPPPSRFGGCLLSSWGGGGSGRDVSRGWMYVPALHICTFFMRSLASGVR